MKSKVGILFTIVMVLCAICWVSYAQTAKPTTRIWEYRSEYNLNDEKLNELGAQGWELVSTAANCPKDSSSCYTNFYLKRAKS